jgi:hypothetical protein
LLRACSGSSPSPGRRFPSSSTAGLCLPRPIAHLLRLGIAARSSNSSNSSNSSSIELRKLTRRLLCRTSTTSSVGFPRTSPMDGQPPPARAPSDAIDNTTILTRNATAGNDIESDEPLPPPVAPVSKTSTHTAKRNTDGLAPVARTPVVGANRRGGANMSGNEAGVYCPVLQLVSFANSSTSFPRPQRWA